MLLVVGVGRVEALGREEASHALLLEIDMVCERRDGVECAGGGWCSLCLRQFSNRPIAKPPSGQHTLEALARD